MNFIVSLAHFCEVHGPTSILCTQAIPTECSICDPSPESITDGNTTVVPTPSPPDNSISPQPQSEEKAGKPRTGLVTQPANPRPSTARAASSTSSSSMSSPGETPPASPKSPVLASSSLPSTISAPSGVNSATIGGTSSTDTCKNCSLSLPKPVLDKLQKNPAGAAKPVDKGPVRAPQPVLRTREVVPAPGLGLIRPLGSDWQDDIIKEGDVQGGNKKYQSRERPASPCETSSTITPLALAAEQAETCFENATHNLSPTSPVDSEDDDDMGPSQTVSSSMNLASQPDRGKVTHNHQITYLSKRAPADVGLYYSLRQSCVRTLSCELLPAHTGAMLFGDPTIGYTIAYVFRIADPKARGGRRSYALLCICSEEKAVVRSWNYIVGNFETLVQRIKGFAALKNVKEKMAAAKINAGALTTSPPSGGLAGLSGRTGGLTGPEGFLRRREGLGSAKGLAELVGKEDLFVELHAAFVRLLGGLYKRYGYHFGKGEQDERGKSLSVAEDVGGRMGNNIAAHSGIAGVERGRARLAADAARVSRPTLNTITDGNTGDPVDRTMGAAALTRAGP